MNTAPSCEILRPAVGRKIGVYATFNVPMRAKSTEVLIPTRVAAQWNEDSRCSPPVPNEMFSRSLSRQVRSIHR